MFPFPFEESIVRTVFETVSNASFLKPITVFFGSVVPWIIAGWFMLSLSRARSFKLKFYYFALAALGIIISRGIITEAAHSFFYSSRPFELFEMTPVIAKGFESGMPSGHMAFLIPLVLAFIHMKKKQGLFAGGLALLAGAARVAGGVHWISDILAGVLAGVAGFFIAKAILPGKLSIGYEEPPEVDEPKRLV